MGPNFICIGAQRSGTTWLHNCLIKHPELWLTPIKELHHFDDPKRTRYFKHLINRLKQNRLYLSKWDRDYFFSIKNDDKWYCRLFKNAQDKRLIAGEVTPAYAILNEADFIRIKILNPEVKIIFIMRNPIDRSWSAFMNAQRKNNVKNICGDLTKTAIGFASKPDALERSFYINTIKKLEKVFDRNKIYYDFYDNIVDNPKKMIKDLLCFLDVNPEYSESILTEKRINGTTNGSKVPNAFINEFAPYISPSLEKLRDRFPTYPSKWIEEIISSLNS